MSTVNYERYEGDVMRQCFKYGVLTAETFFFSGLLKSRKLGSPCSAEYSVQLVVGMQKLETFISIDCVTGHSGMMQDHKVTKHGKE